MSNVKVGCAVRTNVIIYKKAILVKFYGEHPVFRDMQVAVGWESPVGASHPTRFALLTIQFKEDTKKVNQENNHVF